VLRLLRKTFKSFTLLSKNVDNKIVDELMDFDFVIKAAESVSLARESGLQEGAVVPIYMPREGRMGRILRKEVPIKVRKYCIQRSYKFS